MGIRGWIGIHLFACRILVKAQNQEVYALDGKHKVNDGEASENTLGRTHSSFGVESAGNCGGCILSRWRVDKHSESLKHKA